MPRLPVCLIFPLAPHLPACLQEEEARRKAKKSTKGRIRELSELRSELAEKVRASSAAAVSVSEPALQRQHRQMLRAWAAAAGVPALWMTAVPS